MNKFVKILALQMRQLLKRSAVLFVLASFAVNVGMAQSRSDSSKTLGIQFGAMFHSSFGSSVEVYTTLDWPPSKREFWYSTGLQYTRTADGRNRYLLKYGLYHNLFESKKGAFAGIGIGFVPVLAEANGLDLVRDTDKFLENLNYVFPLEIFTGFGQFNLGYQFNIMLFDTPFVEYPTHAIVFYYRLRRGK